MSEAESTMAVTPAKSRRRAVWIILALAGAVVASFAALFVSAWMSAGRRIDAERVRLRDRIAALRAQRVLRPNLFEPAEEGNAWDLHTKALEPIAALPEGDMEIIADYCNGVPAADRGKVDGLLAAAQPHLDGLKLALRRSWVEPGYRYEEGLELMIPQMSPAIRAARFLAAAAKRDHEQGRGEQATVNILAALGLGDHIAVKGSLVSELVGIVCRSIALAALKGLLSDHDLPPAALERLARSMDRLEAAKPDFQDCLRREDIIARSTMQTFEERGDARRSATWRDGFSGQRMAARFYSIQDRFMEELERLARLPAWEREEAGKRIVQGIVDTKSPLHGLLVPQVGRAWRNHWLGEAEWAVARVAVAVARRQAERGSDPPDPKDLAPKYIAKIPADPCRPDTIKMVFQDGSAKVYSGGHDRDDDGGKPPEDDSDDEEGDLVWIVKRRP